MILFSQLSQKFCGISFAVLTIFPVVTVSVKSEAYQLILNRRDAKGTLRKKLKRILN